MAPARRLEDSLAEVIGRLDASEALALALISGFAEEFLFRGVLMTDLGAVGSLVLFTILHTGPGRVYLLWTAFAAIAGGLFTWLTVWSGDLLPAVVAHTLVNAVNLRRLASRAVESADLDA